jgi:hypothetical protein
VDAIIGIVILSGIILGISSFIAKPADIQRKFMAGSLQQPALRAVESIVIDLKESYPPSFQWGQIPPVGSQIDQISFSKPHYAAGSFDNPTETHYLYWYDATRRAIFRSVNSVADPQPLLTNIDPPTASDPLFQVDQNPDVMHVLILTVNFHPQGLDPLRIVRRIAIKG